MKRNLMGLVFGVLVTLLGGTSAQASDDLFESCMSNMKRDCQSWAAKGGGGEAPRGLTSEAKAELAIGEKYILSGTIEIAAGEPFLRIDFRAHPWLASAVRLRNPFYRINDATANWKKYQRKQITIVATARYSAWADNGERTVLEIFLDPAAQPVVTGLQSR